MKTTRQTSVDRGDGNTMSKKSIVIKNLLCRVLQSSHESFPSPRSPYAIMIVPKVSIDHQGFSGTFTHMDEMMEKQT